MSCPLEKYSKWHLTESRLVKGHPGGSFITFYPVEGFLEGTLLLFVDFFIHRKNALEGILSCFVHFVHYNGTLRTHHHI